MSIYNSTKVKITKIIEETPTIKTLVLEPLDKFSFKTGQFLELAYPGRGEAPFTPSSSPHRLDEFEVTIMKVGRLTSLFHDATVGMQLGVRGPYGNGYPVDSFKAKEIVIVGGGVGLAPLRSLILDLFFRVNDFKKIVICYGAKTPDDIIYKYQLKDFQQPKSVEFRLTVDKGHGDWRGNVGLVTTILDDLGVSAQKSIAIVCGPPIMMKFSTFKLLENGFDAQNIYLSMEKNMSCGLGKCGHCRLGKYYVCKDGPVFKYQDIKDIVDIWD